MQIKPIYEKVLIGAIRRCVLGMNSNGETPLIFLLKKMEDPAYENVMCSYIRMDETKVVKCDKPVYTTSSMCKSCKIQKYVFVPGSIILAAAALYYVSRH